MDLRFATPAVLLLLLAVPPIALVAWRQRRGHRAIAIGTLAIAAGAPRTWRVRLEPSLLVLRLLAVALLVVALARPQHGEATAQTRGDGVDIVLAFDVSSSMSQPFARNQSRLRAAEDTLSRFVQARTNDRVGLVLFQGATLTMSPLTTDYTALGQMLKTAGRTNLGDGTAIGAAIGQSVNLMRDSTAPSRIVILLTDGENNVHDIEPGEAARIADKLGVRVYTVGVVSRGSNPGAPDLGVDEQSLRELAQVTGGTYSRAEDPAALDRIYTDIDQLERARFADRAVTRFDEIAPYFLAAAAVALAVELALRHAYFRRAA
jgi:Ca-activated chloride channel family protein